MVDKNYTILEARITSDVKIGKGSKIVMPSNLYGCEIGKECFIGPFCEVQRGVKIGDNTRIQSHSFLCEGVNIGNECFIGHGVMFVNDRFKLGKPAYTQKEYWENTLVGNNVSIGSNATILPVSICNNVVIGAGAVVTKNIDKPGIYAGVPARYLRSVNENRIC